ncbi:MAG: tetraacyldisaccharide 4'-kinase [Thermoguttaceae bacterium]
MAKQPVNIYQTYNSLVRGETRGVLATLARGGLSLIAVPYGVAVNCRNVLYDKRLLKVGHAGVPTIAVGNLTLGGTGKSPMVAWLMAWSESRGLRAGVVSRGYHAASENRVNDEVAELLRKFPSLPHAESPNRLRAAAELRASSPVEILILDDAFQHRRIARDLDIVLLDATAPFGHDRIFPRGTLREPITSLRRADVVVLSRATMIDADARRQIADRVRSINPRVTWCEATHRASGETASWLAGRCVVAFCGIGNPNGFHHTLNSCGAIVGELVAFPDHHHFTHDDLSLLIATANRHNAPLVCTTKDRVKLPTDFPARSIEIEIDFLTGEDELKERLATAVRAT